MTLNLEKEERDLAAAIGARIFVIRRRRKLRAAQLARQVGVHPNTIYRVEAGAARCSVLVLCRISMILDVEIADLIGISSDASPSLVHLCGRDENRA